MPRRRNEAQEQVAELLRTARKSLGLSMSFLTRMDGTTQTLEVVDSAIPLVMRDGVTQRQDTSLCQAILDDRLPEVIPDLRDFPEAMRLPAARFPRIRSYVSVPVTLSDGSLYGTFCAAGLTSDRELQQRDRALMDVLAHAAAVIIEPGVKEAARQAEIESRILPVLDTTGLSVVLQPIVDLKTGSRVGAEALSRFPREWGLGPDAVFEQAHSIGVGGELELLAVERAAASLQHMTEYLAVNLSPGLIVDPRGQRLLGSLPLERIVLEVSEHDPVDDYPALCAAIEPLRARGMRLAIDDAGAGFSSLRHIVLMSPDIIKLDRSIVDGVSHDRVLTPLVRSLVQFAHEAGATTVAEGVETYEDADALVTLGVDLGQGWHFGRPVPPEELVDFAVAGATP